eukprot:CAMPEP_0201541912 /NCGR_PEP_ID=MMETSP0161_2-20130828/71735_1 /ASSEMBLY_ACC=CAM_ASM_000251 /TAXON_ID=180227 /ORGANISM="Neoparamoeba aestuarina, Strain SoJaBio B1-5/56/2" /LENGTH=788 /DNA_ID=CAMNT_0047949489 /DNA_START=84 /DNA_END=2447 /DNA_ORIENTATION=+
MYREPPPRPPSPSPFEVDLPPLPPLRDHVQTLIAERPLQLLQTTVQILPAPVPSDAWLQKRKAFWERETNREDKFLSKLAQAKEECQKILDLDRNLLFPRDYPHTYEDKYSLADFIGIGTIASVLKFFQKLGMEMTSPLFQKLKEQVKTKSVTLRFNSREDCTLVSKKTITREISRTSYTFLSFQTKTTKEVTIYKYKLEAWISLEIFVGNKPQESIVLQEEHMECERVLEDTDIPPHKLTKNEPIDLNVTWLFQHLDDENKVFFCVDRKAEDCATPTRNEEIEVAGEFMNRFKRFCEEVNSYFSLLLFPLDISPFSSPPCSIFVPILPLFEEEKKKEKKKEKVKEIEKIEEIKEEIIPETKVVGKKGKRKEKEKEKEKGKDKVKDKEKEKKEKKKIKGLFSIKPKTPRGGGGRRKKEEREGVKKEKKERMDKINKVMGNLLVFYGGDNEEQQSNVLQESVSLFHSFHEDEEAERISLVPFHLLPQFLSEQSRTIKERMKEISKQFSSSKTFHTATAMKIVCLVSHGIKLSEAFAESVNHIERILYKQFVAAIGREINFVDFDEYMKFHVRKIYRQEYIPKAFSWPVRIEGRDPEGVIQIQQEYHSSRPILTASRKFKANTAMKVVLNAASTATMWGDRHVHLWTNYQFDNQEVPLKLVARAREFSSFILILGTIPTKNVFDPSHAIILKDKDELILPLILETIPTAKEFKAKVNSLSPEQQAFSKAYRALQLASTLFGVMVVPIEPQLEKLLNLDKDSLAKELELQKDVMNLMTEHDVPSSLLSCDE